MGKKKLAAIIAAGAAVVVVLVIVLANLLSGGGETKNPIAPKDAQFAAGTTINGQDVSGLTAEQAKEALEKAPDTYTFTLTMGDKVYRATGTELKLTYNEATDLNALLTQQEKDVTQTAFTVEQLYTADLTAITEQVAADFGAPVETAQGDETAQTAEGEDAAQPAEGEDAAIAPTEDPNAPKNAYLKYDEAQQAYVIVPDEPGTNVDTAKVMEQVQEAVDSLTAELTLDMTQFVQQAEVTADSETLKAALDDANARLDMKLTYTFTPDGGETSTVTIDRATLGSFFCASADGQSVEVDEEVLGNYVANLVSKYSVAGKSTPFKTTGGGTININSVAGLTGNAGQANYSSSKAGVVGLTKTVARELASRHINCNAIAPGAIRTPMTDAMDPKDLQAILDTIPLGFMGEADDIAELAAYLASDKAKYITGEVIRVDGGIAM